METEPQDLEFELRGTAELRLARKFAANGSESAARYLENKGARETEGPESHETVVGAGWQFYLSNAFGFLSNEFADLCGLALQECLPDDRNLVIFLSSKDDQARGFESVEERDRDLDLRGFISLDEDFCSDRGTQMLAALLGSRVSVKLQNTGIEAEFEVVSIVDLGVEGSAISVSSKRALVDQAKVLQRFPDEVCRLVVFAQAVNHYIESCRTEEARRAARRRFAEVILAASNLERAAHALDNTRAILHLDDPSVTS